MEVNLTADEVKALLKAIEQAREFRQMAMRSMWKFPETARTHQVAIENLNSSEDKLKAGLKD